MTELVIKEVRGQHLHISERHRRSRWGAMGELSASITTHGILCNLIVRKRKAGGYEIAAGARRWKAGTVAGLKTFPCVVRELSDEELVGIMVLENRDREDLHPMDEALYCEQLAEMGLDRAMIAKRLQRKRPQIDRGMQLLALSAKARKAYVDGALDSAAALALATTDHAKQADVLAAQVAGSLQLEEIPGYVQRTFTASLDDVPWRTSDEKLLPKAGSCAACPKRSDVQRALFGDEGKGVRCLDVDCWRAKMDASWKKELARPEVAQHDQPADAVFLPNGDGRPQVVRSSGMVDADAACPHVPGKTWREAAFSGVSDENTGPTVYLARDQDGRPRFLLREASVSRTVKKSAPAVAAKESARSADPTPQREGKIRRALIAKLADSVASFEWDTWSWIAERIVDGATARAVSAAGVTFDKAIKALPTEGLDDKPGLLELARQSAQYARRIATVVLLYDTADVVGDIGPAVLVLAATCEADLDAIEHELRGKS